MADKYELTDEKLTELSGYTKLTGAYNSYRKVADEAVANVLRLQAEQTGDIQEKIRGKLQALLEIVAVVDTTTGIPWGLPDEEVIRLSNIVTLDLSTLLSQELAGLKDELRVGNALTAKFCDRCIDLEHQLAQKDKEWSEWIREQGRDKTYSLLYYTIFESSLEARLKVE